LKAHLQKEKERKEAIRKLLTNEQISIFDFLVSNNKAFQIKLSNSSISIYYSGNKIHSGKNLPMYIFGIAKSIKKEALQRAEKIQDIKNVEYFGLSNEITFEQKIDLEYIYSLDITSAYLNILYRDNLISKKNYLNVLNMKKPERLAVIGMLAYRPFVYNFLGSEILSIERQENEAQKIFFYCVNEVNKIMKQMLRVKGALFFWVDCIYFYERSNFYLFNDILKSNRLKGKLKKNYSFSLETDFERAKISFIESGIELKEFNVPCRNNENQKKILEIQKLIHEKNFSKLAQVLTERKNVWN